MEFAGQITLLLHLLGMGLLVSIQVAGFIVGKQYKNAKNLQEKATLLKVMRPFGLLSPIAVGIMLISGIGNMHTFGIAFRDLLGGGQEGLPAPYVWLKIKLVVFVIVAILGVIMGIISKKRGNLVGLMLQGKAPADAESTLKKYDGQVQLFSLILPIALIVILCLSIYGVHGGQ